MAEAIARVARLFCSQAKFTKKMVLRAAKNLSKNWACFSNFKPKNRPNYCVFLQNYVQKQSNTFLMFVIVTGAAKNLWRVAVWPCLGYRVIHK